MHQKEGEGVPGPLALPSPVLPVLQLCLHLIGPVCTPGPPACTSKHHPHPYLTLLPTQGPGGAHSSGESCPPWWVGKGPMELSEWALAPCTGSSGCCRGQGPPLEKGLLPPGLRTTLTALIDGRENKSQFKIWKGYQLLLIKYPTGTTDLHRVQFEQGRKTTLLICGKPPGKGSSQRSPCYGNHGVRKR